MAVVRFGHRPPVTNRQDRFQYTAPLASAQCKIAYTAGEITLLEGGQAEYTRNSAIADKPRDAFVQRAMA